MAYILPYFRNNPHPLLEVGCTVAASIDLKTRPIPMTDLLLLAGRSVPFSIAGPTRRFVLQYLAGLNTLVPLARSESGHGGWFSGILPFTN